MKTQSLTQNIVNSNEVSVELLITDARTANIFLDLAETSGVAELRSRRIGEAQDAYRSILYFLERLSPTKEQADSLGKEMEKLKARLRAVNVAVE